MDWHLSPVQTILYIIGPEILSKDRHGCQMYCRIGAIVSLITHPSVGGDGAGFRSIQDAVNAAEEGDTIEVQSGIYRENVEKSIKEEKQIHTCG